MYWHENSRREQSIFDNPTPFFAAIYLGHLTLRLGVLFP